ncbi:MarR family winged helix-turn-helix transcriptional regulator [Streptomyces sp. NPDC091289]|uniref:MarR family winged helix-turn-helix transcriptional regulator n=1 Tax=Streptomyces sp. NPDC091289 TaxID=3365989 RepID=UPI003801E0E0
MPAQDRAIQESAGPSTTPGAPDHRLGFLLAYHGNASQTLIHKALAATGITPRHMMTLLQLAEGPVTQKALIERLDVDPSVLVALLNDLEGGDLVRRRRDTADRRRHIVEITPQGTSQLRTSDMALDTVEHELFADLSERDRVALRRLLGKLRTSPQDFSCTED